MSISSSCWQSGKQAGTVSLGTHCVYLAANGPQRLIIRGRLQPAVIIETRLCSGLSEWVAISRLIAQRARIYSYDRAEDGRSEPSPNKQYTAKNRNLELATMLLLGNLSYYEIVGLDQNHVVSEEECEMIKTEEKRNILKAHIEESFMEESTIAVNDALPEGYSIIGNKPLSVIFANESVDFTKIHHHAVENSIGTGDARQRLAVRLKDMMQADEGLSMQSRFIYVEGKAQTHNLQYVTPKVIRAEVFWVLGLEG
ncbi:hypothetical protein CBS147346_10498 [Aspergillus niger]|nr:hypothetical protein CBS147346_10498 [Aspergillus niger]